MLESNTSITVNITYRHCYTSVMIPYMDYDIILEGLILRLGAFQKVLQTFDVY